MRSGSINVAGIDLEIAEAGTGAPVLMLHGAGGFRRASAGERAHIAAPAIDLSIASRFWKVRTARLAGQRR